MKAHIGIYEDVRHFKRTSFLDIHNIHKRDNMSDAIFLSLSESSEPTNVKEVEAFKDDGDDDCYDAYPQICCDDDDHAMISPPSYWIILLMLMMMLYYPLLIILVE